ncbi:hypothetical protein QJS10_CPA02g00284 [Acorus calamus]|uniref:Transcription factor MYC/MYB N-terminal domain-containing protein n=1 Tax=Acorus calamus TaxID=4465 RepID=A0AAV9FCI4_ACOCL|nr:hypothetical protein QJS10_CPA02g00284 [Acorus calamus]
MEGGLPMLNCLWHQMLRSFCSWDSCNHHPSKWVYAVLWRRLPRNYPPPKILVWEDGFCDFRHCEQSLGGFVKGRFGPDVFFKMSHEVYSYGEGLIGKVAADNSHKWVFNEAMSESDLNCSSWSGAPEAQPKAWEGQFISGIQTIAVVAVKEGLIQLGSFDKRRFNHLQSVPGLFVLQRPHQSPLNRPKVVMGEAKKMNCAKDDHWTSMYGMTQYDMEKEMNRVKENLQIKTLPPTMLRVEFERQIEEHGVVHPNCIMH